MVNVYEFADHIMRRCDQKVKELLNGEPYLFIPCKSDKPRALAVAHCDTVFDEDAVKSEGEQSTYTDGNGVVRTFVRRSRFTPPAFRKGANRIVSGNLDDRLGVAIILDILPQIMPEFAFDVLLCDDEEIGRSTAGDFVNDLMTLPGTKWDSSQNGEWSAIEDRAEQYQFIFEFDRAGVDVVTYQYHNVLAESLLEDAGWPIGQGSFSDISMMEEMALWAANFGCGYHNQHSPECYVDLRELDINLRRFMYFVDLVGNRTLLDQPRYKYKNGGRYYDTGYDDWGIKRRSTATGGLTDSSKFSVKVEHFSKFSGNKAIIDPLTNRPFEDDDTALEAEQDSDPLEFADIDAMDRDARWLDDSGLTIKNPAWQDSDDDDVLMGDDDYDSPFIIGSQDPQDRFLIDDPFAAMELDTDEDSDPQYPS